MKTIESNGVTYMQAPEVKRYSCDGCAGNTIGSGVCNVVDSYCDDNHCIFVPFDSPTVLAADHEFTADATFVAHVAGFLCYEISYYPALQPECKVKLDHFTEGVLTGKAVLKFVASHYQYRQLLIANASKP